MMARFVGVLCLLSLSLLSVSLATSDFPFSDADMATLTPFFLQNIDYDANGCVIASPSTQHPNYFYHWVRDGAISMSVVLKLGVEKYITQIKDYIAWTHRILNQPDPNGIDLYGEPKFYVDGRPFDQGWCRPQNDGPALRALTQIMYANYLISKGDISTVKNQLYFLNGSTPNIKWDLEFVSHNWQQSNCDLWEEINSDHFFTRLVQRKALIYGAKLANQLNDPYAAAFYSQQARMMESTIDNFWNAQTEVIMASTPGHGGPQKYHELDTAIVLGVLYGYADDGFYSPTNSRIQSTVAALTSVFTGYFNINAADDRVSIPGLLYGRYPNDTYDGYNTGNAGNPWILNSNAVGDLHYRMAIQYISTGRISIDNVNVKFFRQLGFANLTPGTTVQKADPLFAQIIGGLEKTGNNVITRVYSHVRDIGLHLGEQINRETGGQQGAIDLTWSYGTILDAKMTHTQLQQALKQSGLA